MDSFLALSSEDKKTAFEEAAKKLDVLPTIVEKDFWVCWCLKQIFDHATLAQNVTILIK